MIGVTFGIGSYREIAIAAAKRMAEHTGVHCHALVDNDPRLDGFKDKVTHPSWLKCFVTDMFPEHDAFLTFDADITCLRPWKPDRLFEDLGGCFCAVADQRSQNVYEECLNFGISFPDIYVNAGLLMFGTQHKPIWQEVYRKHPAYGTWLEQTALNVALLETEMPVCRLPKRFNWISQMAKYSLDEVLDDDGVNVHFCGLKSVKEVKQAQRKYGLNAIQEPVEIAD